MLQVCAVDFTAYYFLGALIRGCRDAGWTTEFACADGPFAQRLRAEGFRHRVLPVSRSISPLRNAAATAILMASLRSDPVDVVHTHTPAGGIVGRAAATVSGAHVIHTFHGLPFPDRPRSLPERAFLEAERVLARRTERFFSQALGDAERAVALGIARRDALTVIGNGVDLARFRPDDPDRARVRDDLGIPHDAFVVIAVTRLVREKGVLDLASAMGLLSDDPRIHLVLVGDALASDRDPIARELDAHPAARSLAGRWHRLGHRDDVDLLLRAADVFALPSYREGLPRSIVEALASGLPVIATDIPACRELVDPSVGYLVPVRDPRALADAIAAAAADETGRRAMSAQARVRATERHDERRIVQRQIEVIAALPG